jgi:hypothetical protein
MDWYIQYSYLSGNNKFLPVYTFSIAYYFTPNTKLFCLSKWDFPQAY